MNKTFSLVVLSAFVLTLAGCSYNADQDENYQRKKIYLTEQDYLEDLGEAAQAERREAKPNTESEYVYHMLPETEKNVYFFDERVRPMVPGQPSERDYKAKRLWQKPKRYSPSEYYGGQPAAAQEESTPAPSTSADEYDY